MAKLLQERWDITKTLAVSHCPNSGMFRPRSMTKWERHPARVEHPEESGSCNTNRSCCHPNSLSQSKHTLHCTGLWYRDRRPNRHCGSSCFGGNRFKVSHSSGKQAYILCLERDTSTSLPQPWCVLRSLDEPFWKSSCNSCNPKGKKTKKNEIHLRDSACTFPCWLSCMYLSVTVWFSVTSLIPVGPTQAAREAPEPMAPQTRLKARPRKKQTHQKSRYNHHIVDIYNHNII